MSFSLIKPELFSVLMLQWWCDARSIAVCDGDK